MRSRSPISLSRVISVMACSRSWTQAVSWAYGLLRRPRLGAFGQFLLDGGIEAGILQGQGGELAEATEQGQGVAAHFAARLDIAQAQHAGDLGAGLEGYADGVEAGVAFVAFAPGPRLVVVHVEGFAVSQTRPPRPRRA
jgi:hypothetical protein